MSEHDGTAVRALPAGDASAIPERAERTRRARTGSAHDAELEELWAAFKGKGDRGARSTLIERYWPLVRYVAKNVALALPSQVSLDDLQSYGVEGLIRAVDRFDPDRGVRFSTFAVLKIRGAIQDGLRSEDWAFRSVRRKEREIEDTRVRLWNSLRRAPTETEEATALGIPIDALRTVKQAIASAAISSLDVGDPDHLNATSEDAVDSTFESYAERERREQVRAAVDALPARERTVIRLSFGAGETLSQIGEQMGVSESRVCQIRMGALKHLRERMAGSQFDAAVACDAT